MHQKLTILFAPVDAVGHVNACIGIAEVLRCRGHRIVFAISDTWRGKLTKYGFEEEIIVVSEGETIEDPGKFWADFFKNIGMFSSIPPIEKIKNMNAQVFPELINRIKNSESIMKKIVERIEPDIILIDGFVWTPSLMNSGIPWVWSISCNPLVTDYAMDDDRIPPSALGLPANGDRKVWKNLREQKNETTKNTWTSYNDWLLSNGFNSLPQNKFLTPSPYLNIYMFPEELDYTDLRQLPSNWYQFDCFKRSGDLDTFEIPEKLKNRSGKLIYLSMGSMGGADVDLMKKLVLILSKSKHRFIVSKGPLSDQYELADNMWGEKTVPQVKVLPIVDLVITHGGNNTVTETFFFGKPMIVMPLFVDQYDNAQRIEEKGFGIRLDPYECEENQLLESIENLLNDERLALKLNKMSKRIQSSNNITKITELIEDLVRQKCS